MAFWVGTAYVLFDVLLLNLSLHIRANTSGFNIIRNKMVIVRVLKLCKDTHMLFAYVVTTALKRAADVVTEA